MDLRCGSQERPTRRTVLRSAGLIAAWAAMGPVARAEEKPVGKSKTVKESPYETQARGIRILPGQWRPHYAWEHIAWVSPAWPSQEYVWLDFPEAIFSSQGLLYLSHINPPFPAVFGDLPRVPWQALENGIGFERTLPNGIAFGGSVLRSGEATVDLTLFIRNGSDLPLRDIALQTCAFLRGIKEFADYTLDNKFVHVPEGWVPLEEALGREEGAGPYRVGWRQTGRLVADRPVAVVVSNRADRLMAMSWGPDTLSMVGNPHHPCIHADPRFTDLEPGATGTVRGRLVFFEGSLDDFRPEDHFS